MNSLCLQEYLSKITDKLKQQHYNIKNNTKYENQGFEYVAKRTRLEIEKSGFCTTLFLFAKFNNPDYVSLKEFSNKSFNYAKKLCGIHPPRGLFYGIWCFPVAITNSIDEKTRDSIRYTDFPKYWCASEKLVVLSLDNQELYYCENTPMWGALYHDNDRQMINEILSP